MRGYTVLPLSQRPHPVSDCLSDLIRRVLLKEVNPAHGYLCMRRPAPAELPLGPDQNAPRLTVHEKLGNGTVREPLGVGAHYLDHVGGFPIQRYLARPGECGTAPLARLGKWAAVVRHLPLGQATQDLQGQDLLNEEVVLEDHRFSGLRAQGLEDRAEGLGHLVPREWPHQGLQVCKTLPRVAVAVSPVEAEGRSPVVDDEGDPFMHTECREQGVEVAAVLNKGVRAGAAGRELVGVAHADEVGRDTVPELLEVRDHIAPEIRRRGVAVEEDDRITLAHIDIGHRVPQDLNPLLLVAGICTDHNNFLPFLLYVYVSREPFLTHRPIRPGRGLFEKRACCRKTRASRCPHEMMRSASIYGVGSLMAADTTGCPLCSLVRV